MKISKPTILLLMLIALSMSVYSQDNFKPGYAITLTGDTLFGEINYKGDIEMGRICTFKQADGEIIRYTSNELIEYHFPGLKYFVSKKYNGSNYFFEFLTKGRVNMYFMKDQSQDHYYIENNELGLAEIPYKNEIRLVKEQSPDGSKSEQEYRYKSKQHIGLLSLYMKDAPQIKKDIEKIHKPEHGNLIKLAQKYNAIVCEEECIIYEKKLSKIGINVEVVGGFTRFPVGKNLGREWRGDNNKSTYFQGGILAHIWMPRTSESLYFRTGLLYANTKTDKNNTVKVYKIPVQFEYLYPRDTFIRPRIGGGLNIYSPFENTLALTAGVNIKLAKRFYWTINYDLDFESEMIIIPKGLNSHSFTSGLYIVFD